MKCEIEVEGLPEGWRVVRIGLPDRNDYILYQGGIEQVISVGFIPHMIVEKIQPRRIVLEETGEVRKAVKGEFCVFSCQVDESAGKYKIWREVK